jgi:hypothetical protein
MNELDVKCAKAKHTIRIIKNGFIEHARRQRIRKLILVHMWREQV